MTTLIVTACGAKKNDQPMEAWKLYKSPRIRLIHQRKGEYPMAILSAKYGLIDSEEIIEPYDQKMDQIRAQELVPVIVEKVREYDKIVFFKGGSSKPYLECIGAACERASVDFAPFGYANMGDINDLEKYL
jgi:hypothetical protein